MGLQLYKHNMSSLLYISVWAWAGVYMWAYICTYIHVENLVNTNTGVVECTHKYGFRVVCTHKYGLRVVCTHIFIVYVWSMLSYHVIMVACTLILLLFSST